MSEKPGQRLFFLLPDAGCCTPTASTLLQVGTLVAAQVNPCAALSDRAALPSGYHRARISGHLQGMFQGACGIYPTSAWEGSKLSLSFFLRPCDFLYMLLSFHLDVTPPPPPEKKTRVVCCPLLCLLTEHAPQRGLCLWCPGWFRQCHA